VLEQNSISFSFIISYLSDSLDVMTQRVLGVGRPSIETNNDSFVLQKVSLESSYVKITKFIISRNKFINLIILLIFIFIYHTLIFTRVYNFLRIDTAAVISLLSLVNGSDFATGY